MKKFLRGLLHFGATPKNPAKEQPSPLKRPAETVGGAEQPIIESPPAPPRPAARAELLAEPATPSEPSVAAEPSVTREPKVPVLNP